MSNMLTRSRTKQLQQENGLIRVGLKYEEVQRVRKQNKYFSWMKFLLSTTAFLVACFASMKVAQNSGTNMMGSVYDFSERVKESFLTIPYKIPGYSFLFGEDHLSNPSMPWIILDGALSSDHLFYQPNSTIHSTLQEKQREYDTLTETIYEVLVAKTNYETLMMNSQHFLRSLPQVRQILTDFYQQTHFVNSKKGKLCSTNILGTVSCNSKQSEYTYAVKDLEELRVLRSYTMDFLQFPALYFRSSKFLKSFPSLSINASTFQSILLSRETLLHQTSSLDSKELLKLASRFVFYQSYSNSTILQHTLNSLLSPLLQVFSQMLTHLYKKQSNLLSQIGLLQTAYTSTMVEKQYDDAVVAWDGFISQCSDHPNPICSIVTPANRVRFLDIVYELRSNSLPIPENFQVLIQKVFLNSERYQNATARDMARVLRIEKYKKNPDPYSLLLSGSVGFLFFSGSYYVFFDRLSTIMYAITIPFDMIIAWGENWMHKKNFETEQFFQTQYQLLPDVPQVSAERTQIVQRNTHKA
jgi:hypothetical protein